MMTDELKLLRELKNNKHGTKVGIQFLSYNNHHHINRLTSTAEHRPPPNVATATDSLLLASSGCSHRSKVIGSSSSM